jgi:hypothetical protein
MAIEHYTDHRRVNGIEIHTLQRLRSGSQSFQQSNWHNQTVTLCRPDDKTSNTKGCRSVTILARTLVTFQHLEGNWEVCVIRVIVSKISTDSELVKRFLNIPNISQLTVLNMNSKADMWQNSGCIQTHQIYLYNDHPLLGRRNKLLCYQSEIVLGVSNVTQFVLWQVWWQ